MKITKFKKDKGNTYKIYFDDDVCITLFDDVIVKYNLLSNKFMDKDKFDEIIKYNDFLDGYYKSIKYINKKLRTELEIEKYLNKLGINNLNIKKIIDLLREHGYLNREMYIKAYISDQYNLTNNGPLKINKDLISLGFEESEFNECLFKFDWDSRIEKLVLKKIKINHKLSNNSLKIKIMNDIIKLGYMKEKVILELDKINLNSDIDNLKKELIKIKSRYSRKLSGNELEYKVINYLFNKGYDLNDIKRCYNEDKI